MIHKLKNLQFSIFTKLLLIVLLLWGSTNFMFFLFLPAFRDTLHTPLQNNITRYVQYLIQEIGTPPSLKRAQDVAKPLFLEIRYESSDLNWTTSEEIPFIQDLLGNEKWGTPYILVRQDGNPELRRARHWKIPYIIIEKEEGRYLFTTTFRMHRGIRDEKILIFLLLITLTLIAAYFMIKWVFKPIQWLTEGVAQISQANLNHKVPTERKDELGKLAHAFNSMTQSIRERIHAQKQLLLDVSHELRSPLTRINVALEFLPESSVKTSIKEDVQEVESMVFEILETARLGNEHGHLNIQKINLLNLIHEACHNLYDHAPGIQLQEIHKEQFLEIDPARISTVLRNLIQNALKYSTTDSHAVQISQEQNDEYVIVKIRDYGEGIPEEELPFIFEPFYRIDKSRSKESGGYGLGLSLCKTIMEAHQGSIAIESTLKEGSTVSLLFPIDLAKKSTSS